MECGFRKLVMDFDGLPAAWCGPSESAMDEEDAERLIATLCTVVGMLMEDALPAALFRPASVEEITGNLASLSAMAADIAALIGAAEVVARRRRWL